MTASPQGLAVGEVLAGRYKLVQEIGRGGFGVVYRATQLGMNRDVAVKLLHTAGASADPEMRERFKREAMMARNLNHPHTIRQYDFGETDDGMMYLVLEFLEGQNLVQTLREEGALGDDRVRRMAAGVLKSLSEAHAQGIVHRDLKPANIMLCEVYGEKDYVKVLDFGIAKTVMGDTDLTAAGVALGSPRYMAPELLRGDNPTPGSDVYAIAITFAEAIMAKPLINVENSVEAAQLQLSPKPLPVPDELKGSTLWPWLSIALKKDEKERYQSAEEMLDFLAASPAKLAERGADFHTAEEVTTQSKQVPNATIPQNVIVDVEAATAPHEQPDLRTTQQEQPPPQEDDDNAATMRIDGADVDAFLKSRGTVSPTAATAEADRDDDEEEVDAYGETSVVSPEDLIGTNPSQQSIQGPRFDVGDRGLGAVDPEDSRMTTPLRPPEEEKEDATQMVTFEEAKKAQPNITPTVGTLDDGMDETAREQPPVQAVQPGRHQPMVVGATAPADNEERTEMVSLEEAMRQPTGTQSEARTEMLSLEEALKPPVGGDAKTQALDAVPEQFRTAGTHRPGMGTGPVGGPQISGQAFDPSATPGDQMTAFVPIDQVNRQQPVVQESNRKYIVWLAAFLIIGMVGLSGIAFAIYTATKSGESEIPDQPVVNVPTNITSPQPTAQTVEFRIFTEPERAALVIDGTEKGRTPAKFSLPDDQLPLSVDIALEGYEQRTVKLQKGGATEFKLVLEKLPEAPKVEDKPKPKPKPDPKPKPKPKPKPDPKPKPKPKPDDEGIPIF